MNKILKKTLWVVVIIIGFTASLLWFKDVIKATDWLTFVRGILLTIANVWAAFFALEKLKED